MTTGESSDNPLATRIAIAALVVTLVVGVLAPIVTARSTVHAAEVSARAQRVASDLPELRTVLDRALHDLEAQQKAERTIADEWELAMQGRTKLLDLIDRWDGYDVRSAADLARIELRLGPSAPIPRAFRSASDAYDGAVGTVQGDFFDHLNQFVAARDDPKEKPIVAMVEGSEDEAVRAQRAFLSAAYELIGSRLR